MSKGSKNLKELVVRDVVMHFKQKKYVIIWQDCEKVKVDDCIPTICGGPHEDIEACLNGLIEIAREYIEREMNFERRLRKMNYSLLSNKP